MGTWSDLRRVRLGLLAILVGIASLSTGAAPTLAQTSTSFSAYFDEQTTIRQCPPGVPAGATCFTGHGDGTASPPGGNADEDYAGYVDNARREPNGCAPDANAVVITTSQGRLFLTTRGRGCPSGPPDAQGRVPIHDEGVWTAYGGTGIFYGARGSGTVVTDGLFTFNPDGTPRSATSQSRYTGTLTLR